MAEVNQSTQPKEFESSFTYYAIMADQGRVFRKVLESISAAGALILGLMFVANGYEHWPQDFFPMAIVAPSYVWGAVMVMLSTARIFVIVVNGWWPYSHRVRKWLSGLFIFGVWLPMAATYWWNLQTDVVSGLISTHPGLAYSLVTLGTEFLIYYAHASFVYAIKRG